MNKMLTTLLGLILVGSVYGNQWLAGCKEFCRANNPSPSRCYQRCEKGDTYPTPEGLRHSLTGELERR